MKLHHHWPLRLVAEKICERRFFATDEWQSLHLGVFSSFAEARAFCRARGVACDYALDHDWWAGVQSEVHLYDYPMLFWLDRIVTPNSRIGDLGGSVGVSYYTLEPVLQLNSSVEWRVCELPEVVEQGKSLARERGAKALHFTTSVRDLDAHDIWFTAGAIQFIERPLHEMLRELPHPPAHLLINRVPVHESKSFVTLQNTGSAIAPCYIFHEKEFVEQLESVGYHERNEWRCSTHSLYVPLHPDFRVREFRGYYFRRRLDS